MSKYTTSKFASVSCADISEVVGGSHAMYPVMVVFCQELFKGQLKNRPKMLLQLIVFPKNRAEERDLEKHFYWHHLNKINEKCKVFGLNRKYMQRHLATDLKV